MSAEKAARQERARIATERLRLAVAEHAAEPPCGEPDCVLHRPRTGGQAMTDPIHDRRPR